MEYKLSKGSLGFKKKQFFYPQAIQFYKNKIYILNSRASNGGYFIQSFSYDDIFLEVFLSKTIVSFLYGNITTVYICFV